MSITDAVRNLVAQGKLIDRPSPMTGTQGRKLYVVPHLDSCAMPPFADTNEGARYAALALYFDAFSEMSMISVSENPRRKPPDVMLARVAPPEDDFWSMRITDPEDTAGMRVLGAFCEKDEFVAVHWEFREVIEQDFDAEVETTREIWADLFGTERPHTGGSLDDYLSQYFKI